MDRIIESGNGFVINCFQREEAVGTDHYRYNVVHTYPNESPQGFCEWHLADVSFQNGDPDEVGVNGCGNEDVLRILIDRVKSFTTDEFTKRDNEVILERLEDALMRMEKVAKERSKRGVTVTPV